MTRSAVSRLRDIVNSSQMAQQYGSRLDAEALSRSGGARNATLYQIAIIGEAVSFIPSDVLALAPEISGGRVKAMRNRIIHGYWQIDLTIVADTVAHDLQPLQAAAERLIQLLDHAGP